MPAEFDAFGVRFLYPDNWTVAERDESEGDLGTTIEFPGGGFFSIERVDVGEVEELIESVVKAIASDYDELERETASWESLPPDMTATELRFYYLDLMIVSRIVVLPDSIVEDGTGDEMFVVQMQAESRDFEKNEPVFAAIMKQILG